jgi:hypothetical protein
MQTLIKPTLGLTLGLALSLTGCGGDGGDGGAATGRISLAVMDAPVDSASSVVVEFTGLELKPESGPSFTIGLDPARQVDLYDLQEGMSEYLVIDETVPSGRYNWVRLLLNAEEGLTDSYIEMDDGSRHSLHIPSGAQTGLKLVSGFLVPVNGDADFVIDFDLRKSVVKPEAEGQDYKLKPALRMVNMAEAGDIGGTVDSTLLAGSGCTGANAVYVFEGTDPDDEDGIAPDPVTSALVNYRETEGIYAYRVAYLVPGDYTVALTCNADLDGAEDDFPAGSSGFDFVRNEDGTIMTRSASVSVDTLADASF